MENKDNIYTFRGTGLSVSEKNAAKKRFEDYISAYPHLNKLSLLQLLEELVFLEAISERYKNKIAKISKNKQVKDSGVVPSNLMRELSDNTKQVLELKEKLGLFESKDKIDAFTDLENLKKKSAIYRKEHPLSFKTTCPFCSKIYFLKRKTENYTPHVSPFFENKILVNRPLFKLYHEGRITKQEIAEAHGTSEDYIDWVEENILKIKKSK